MPRAPSKRRCLARARLLTDGGDIGDDEELAQGVSPPGRGFEPHSSGGSWTSMPPEVTGIIHALHNKYRQGGSWQRRMKSAVEDYDVDLRAMIQPNMYGTIACGS